MFADLELSRANLKCDRRMDQCDLPSFALDPVAEDDRHDLALLSRCCRELE